jgi:hypothetical protein
MGQGNWLQCGQTLKMYYMKEATHTKSHCMSPFIGTVVAEAEEKEQRSAASFCGGSVLESERW